MTDLFHYTCTKHKVLADRSGDCEHLFVKDLNLLFKAIFGYSVSDDPLVARGDRERALIRDKQEGYRFSKELF